VSRNGKETAMKRSNESENKIFKPKFDKHFVIILSICLPVMSLITALCFVPQWNVTAFIITLICDAFIVYFLVTSFFGYVELRENTLFVKFGILTKREIPYEKIRKLKKGESFYSESMLSLKNSFEHVNIFYNAFDAITVSVKDNDAFIEALEKRIN
jgi:hypothetical protein